MWFAAYDLVLTGLDPIIACLGSHFIPYPAVLQGLSYGCSGVVMVGTAIRASFLHSIYVYPVISSLAYCVARWGGESGLGTWFVRVQPCDPTAVGSVYRRCRFYRRYSRKFPVCLHCCDQVGKQCLLSRFRSVRSDGRTLLAYLVRVGGLLSCLDLLFGNSR